MTTPDKWLVLKIGDLYKVYGTWYGGYLGSDSWKINSGIVKVEEDEYFFKFYRYSGSCYECKKGCYGTNLYTQGVLNEIIKIIKENNIEVEILPETTDWSKLLTNSLT